LHLLWTERADLDEDALLEYLRCLFDAEMMDQKKLLLWNRFGCQMNEELSEFLAQKQVDNQLAPSGSGAAVEVGILVTIC
jgi:hypothetical protein